MSFSPRIFPWLNRPNPVPPQERTSLVAPGPRFNEITALHSHVRQPQPDPGIPAYAYEALGLVEWSPIGWATANRDYLFPLSTVTPWFAQHAVTVQGLGGLVRGQFIGQPLLYDPALQSEELSVAGIAGPFTV